MARERVFGDQHLQLYRIACRARTASPISPARAIADFELMMYPGHLWPATTDAAARRALRTPARWRRGCGS